MKVALLVAVIAAGASWKVQDWRYGNEISQIRQSAAEAQTKAVDDARATETARYEAVQASEREARERENAQRIAANRARAESDSLRDDIAALEAAMPERTEAAVREYAVTAGRLLNDCTKEYQSMAETAQRHASDVQTLIEAWPQ